MQGPVFRNSIENITPYADFFRVRICVYPCQAFATGESIVADGGDGIGDGDAGQAAATIERAVADGGDGAWDGDARQAGAVIVFATHCVSVCFNQNGRKVIA